MDKILVLAGNYQEYKVAKSIYTHERYDTSDWVYAASWKTVVGRRFRKQIKIGTWRERYSAHDLYQFGLATVGAPELNMFADVPREMMI